MTRESRSLVKAREVFKDCEYAKECFQQALDQKRFKDAKLLWFASVAMLRAIGHVLKKVDSKTRGDAFNHALDTRYEHWKREPIFADFIERERNIILKVYESSLTEQEIIEESFLITESGDQLVTESGDELVVMTAITTLVKGSGAFSGEKPAYVLSKALAWWDKELSELEQI